MYYFWLFESIGEINVIDFTNSAMEDLCGHLAKLIDMLGQFNQCSVLARCSENFLQLQN
jgi:pyruvate/2-oxoglutarate/acetoin dehydrogenase E1 component